MQAHNVTISAENTAKMTGTFVSNLYTQPLEATVRETFQNAQDADLTKTPTIEIDPHKKELRVHDHGPGMSPEFVLSTYREFGGTTKINSTTETGGHGLGRFAPLAYSRQFTLMTQNHTYMIMMNNDDHITVSDPIPTKSETTGTTVIVPLLTDYDISRAERYAKALLTPLTTEPAYRLETAPIAYYPGVHEGILFRRIRYPFPYSIDTDGLGRNFLLELPDDAPVVPAPARESVKSTPELEQIINRHLEEARVELAYITAPGNPNDPTLEELATISDIHEATSYSPKDNYAIEIHDPKFNLRVVKDPREPKFSDAVEATLRIVPDFRGGLPYLEVKNPKRFREGKATSTYHNADDYLFILDDDPDHYRKANARLAYLDHPAPVKVWLRASKEVELPVWAKTVRIADLPDAPKETKPKNRTPRSLPDIRCITPNDGVRFLFPETLQETEITYITMSRNDPKHWPHTTPNALQLLDPSRPLALVPASFPKSMIPDCWTEITPETLPTTTEDGHQAYLDQQDPYLQKLEKILDPEWKPAPEPSNLHRATWLRVINKLPELTSNPGPRIEAILENHPLLQIVDPFTDNKDALAALRKALTP